MGVRAGICRLGAVVLVAAAALAVSSSSGSAAVRPALRPFRGLGTWVDIYDTSLRADPEAAVAAMSANGVRTLYLETANYRASERIVAPDTVGRFIVAAHAHDMRVVAWYLPSLGRPARDRSRSLAAIRYRTPDGQRFDAFALDIEAATVTDVSLRSRRAVDLAEAIRAAAGRGYALGAIVPAPEGMRLNPGYWPRFPFRSLHGPFDVFLPMDYFTGHEPAGWTAHSYTMANVSLLRSRTGDPAVPIHLVGGIADAATTADVTGFVHAARQTGALGASLYDDATTSSTAWTALQAAPDNPRQRPPLPLRLPAAAAVGNIPGGDRSHPKEVFYASGGLRGSWAVRLRVFDAQAGEVELWVNWQPVRTVGASAAGAWSPVRTLPIPAGILRPGNTNSIQLVAAGGRPGWSVWGVRGVSLVRR